MAEALCNEKAVGRDTQGGLMMKALPARAPEMWEGKLQLEFLKVPLDALAHLGDKHQLLQCHLIGGGKEKVFCRL